MAMAHAHAGASSTPCWRLHLGEEEEEEEAMAAQPTAHQIHDMALLAERQGRRADAVRLHDDAKKAFLEAAHALGSEDESTSKSFILLAEFHRARRRMLKKSAHLSTAEEKLLRREPVATQRMSLPSASRALQTMADEVEQPSALAASMHVADAKPMAASRTTSSVDSPLRPGRAASPPIKFGEESFYLVAGEDMAASTRFGPDTSFLKRPTNANDAQRLLGLVKSLQTENERLTKERDDARRQVREEQQKMAQLRQRFFAMFVALKANLEKS